MSNFVIAATRSMTGYAAGVVEKLLEIPEFEPLGGEINGVGLLKADRFADGEMEVAINESIRGKTVVLFTSSARNDAGVSVEEAKIELYQAVDALKRAQAKRIIIFEPFISCSRSDRTARRSSVGLWVHVKILSSLGMTHLITYQLHSDKSKSMVDPVCCVVDDIPALNLLKRYICRTYIRDFETLDTVVRQNWAFCSVDAGGEKIARDFANSFGAQLVVAHKQRDYSRANTIESINILSAEPVEGKTLWIVDDMIDTGGSVESLIRALAPHKPAEVNLVAVHALFSAPAAERLTRLANEGLVKRILVSDTVYASAPGPAAGIPGLEIVPSAGLSAKILKAVLLRQSMSKLLRPFKAELYLGLKEGAD